MTKPTPRQTEIAMIAHRLRTNAHAPGDRTRLEKLVQAEVIEQLQPVLADLERQLPELRRKVAEQRRRAEMAAGRQAQPRYMSEAQRQARDRILRQKR